MTALGSPRKSMAVLGWELSGQGKKGGMHFLRAVLYGELHPSRETFAHAARCRTRRPC